MPLGALTSWLGSSLNGSNGRLHAAMAVGVFGLGAVRVLGVAGKQLRFVWRKFLRPAKNVKNYGSWAVVTGATDGIGRAICDELAKKGMNIFLVSRTEAKLKNCAEQISQEYGVDTRYHCIDLAAAGSVPLEAAEWSALKKDIDEIDVGVLINNAGMLGDIPTGFHELPPASVHDIVSLNTCSVVKMTYVVLPGMLERGRGAVVNVSSFTSLLPVPFPLWHLYVASKSFMNTMTGCFATDYGPKGIHFQAQAPGLVSTKAVNSPDFSVVVPSAAEHAKSMVRAIGYETLCTPYWFHAFQLGALGSLPKPMVSAALLTAAEKAKQTGDFTG